MSAEENLQPKQFKWTPNKYHMSVRDHLRREHKDMTPKGGWSHTTRDEEQHAAAHAADSEGISGTVPHKHFQPKQFR